MFRALLLVFMVVLLDQLSKIWVVINFGLYERLEIIPHFFDLTYITNRGAAFGILAGVDGVWRHYLFLILGGSALVLLVIFWRRMHQDHPFYGVALSLIAGGAIGNIVDRVRFGAVVDFLDFYVAGYHWPAFNIADSAIFVGVVIFIVTNYLEERRQKKAED